MDKAQYRASLRELSSASQLDIVRRLEQPQVVSIYTTESNILNFHRKLEGGKENPLSQTKDIIVQDEYFQNIFIFSNLKQTLVMVSACNGSKVVLWATTTCKKSYYFGRGFYLMWYMYKVPGLLSCCLLTLLVGGWGVWWGCDAFWCWVAVGSVLVWFAGVCVSLVLSAGHMSPSIIVVYSMLY